MIIPTLLQPGDTVSVVATARRINESDLNAAVEILSLWGLNVVLSENILSESHPYFSGSDDERLNDIQSAINNPEIKAIICARGGYGTTRIVDEINTTPLLNNHKWLVGFSDITSLHLKLLKNNLASIHGTMPILFSKSESASSVETLRMLLFSGTCRIECAATNFNIKGSAEGIVVGGNLSLINDSLGTATELDTSDKILIIEEVDEYRYRLDRMMTQLRRAGKLKNLRALLVGHMTDVRDSDPEFGESVESIIMNAVRGYSYPVAFGFPSGHENPNYAWVSGGTASLIVSDATTQLHFTKLS